MNDDPVGPNAEDLSEGDLQALVECLNRGEEHAIQRAYQAYQPFLRMIVRRRLSPPLRARVDSMDIVQSIWADLLPGFRRAGWKFPDATRFRSFLIRVTRNRLMDRQRKHGPSFAREQPIADSDSRCPAPHGTERASQVVQASDLWERMLASCPPSHRKILLLKREGLTSAEIAARVGLHEGSVRRVLCDLARRLGYDARAGSLAAIRCRG
jgi:RNA polymerase sigma factor (sigma-70 family)